MADDPDKPVDLWPYLEDDLMERAFRAMREKRAQELEDRYAGLDAERGTVFVNDVGVEVGYLMPVLDIDATEEDP